MFVGSFCCLIIKKRSYKFLFHFSAIGFHSGEPSCQRASSDCGNLSQSRSSFLRGHSCKQPTNQDAAAEAAMRRRQRTTQMLVLTVISHVACCFPFNLYTLLQGCLKFFNQKKNKTVLERVYKTVFDLGIFYAKVQLAEMDEFDT